MPDGHYRSAALYSGERVYAWCCPSAVFSIGLAITLVSVGAAAAFSVRQATKLWSGLDKLARRAPYFSSVLIAFVGIYMGYHGWLSITN